THTILGVDRFRWSGSGPLAFRLHPKLKVESVKVNGSPHQGSRMKGDSGRWQSNRPLEPGRHEVEVRYSGAPPEEAHPEDGDQDPSFGPRVTREGIYLAGGFWYPRTGNHLHTYRLTVTVPREHRLTAPGRRTEEETEGDTRTVRFRMAQPTERAVLVGGPHRIRFDTTEEGIPVATSFPSGLEDLTAPFLEDTADHLQRFQERYGPYPHSGFTVVSSPWPAGFGFPGIAYLGRRILPMGFIREQSLPHEILHSWWGNGVYVEPDSGNWAEGLTTYGADYRLRARGSEEAAREIRLRWLQDFASYHRDEPAPALRHFQARVDQASRTRGYNKAAFLWIMLRDRLGNEAFQAALRRFYERNKYQQASWGDLQRAFEQAAEQNLDPVFQAWLDRPGAPRLRIANLRSGGRALELTLAQEEPAYPLRLPVHIHRADGTVRKETVSLTRAEQTFRWTLDGPAATRVAVDPEYRVFRHLAPSEVPPRLSAVMAAGGGGLRLPAEHKDTEWEAALGALAGALWPEDSRVEDGEREEASIRVVSPNELAAAWEEVDGRRPLPDFPEEASTRVLVGRAGPQASPTLLIAADSPGDLEGLARALTHYGSYGWLAFRNGRNVAKGRWPAPARPLSRALEGSGGS
ncbi:MAG: M1 family metallopeptidase, partial [Thiohalorhabdus sp.]